jgi:hypothetical protein
MGRKPIIPLEWVVGLSFDELLKRVLSVPKSVIVKRMAEEKEQRKAERERKKLIKQEKKEG